MKLFSLLPKRLVHFACNSPWCGRFIKVLLQIRKQGGHPLDFVQNAPVGVSGEKQPGIFLGHSPHIRIFQ